jgi:hypothetical protein
VLRAVVEELVTPDGTGHSSIVRRIETVLHHLEAARVETHFDEQTETRGGHAAAGEVRRKESLRLMASEVDYARRRRVFGPCLALQ